MSSESTSGSENKLQHKENEYKDDFHSDSETSYVNSHERSNETNNTGAGDETQKTIEKTTDLKENESKTKRSPSSKSTRQKKTKDASSDQRQKTKKTTPSKVEKNNHQVRKNKEEEKKSEKQTAPKRDSGRRYLRVNSKSQQRNASSTSTRSTTKKPSVREGSGKSVHWYSSDEMSEESSSTDSDKDENQSRELRPELTAEYWDIHKLVRFLKVGNPTVTLIALCALDEFNLHQEMTQLSVVDLGGISILLNLLNTKQKSCVIGSLKILIKLSKSRVVNNEIYRLKGVEQIIDSLSSRYPEVQSLAAGTLANFASFRKAYRAVKVYNGIPILVKILKNTRNNRPSSAYATNENEESLRKNVCEALWSCSRCSKNIHAVREAGAVSILSSLLKNGSNEVILCCVGIIQECSSDCSFRDDIRKEGIIEDVVRLLRSGDDVLKTLCANAIFKCGDDVETQKLVLKHDGLDHLVDVLKSTNQYSDKNLLCAVAGAVWKCGSYKENIERLEYLGTLGYLIKQLKNEHPLEVEANILGALSVFAYNRKNIKTMYEEGVLHIAINKLNVTDPNVLINSTRILALCAKEVVPRREILNSDGVRLLWSLLKSSNNKVVASAAYSIAMCVSNAMESAEIVRSFVGGLELVTKLLRSNRREVLISVCQMVINIGQDRENMSIMTDYDVIPLLISLVYADDEELHQYVAEAIAACCNLEENIKALSPTVVPLSDGLRTYSNIDVHRTTALALEKLSNSSHNCFIIHKNGAIKHLLKMMASQDHAVQEAAARCIKNVRINISANAIT